MRDGAEDAGVDGWRCRFARWWRWERRGRGQRGEGIAWRVGGRVVGEGREAAVALFLVCMAVAVEIAVGVAMAVRVRGGVRVGGKRGELGVSGGEGCGVEIEDEQRLQQLQRKLEPRSLCTRVTNAGRHCQPA